MAPLNEIHCVAAISILQYSRSIYDAALNRVTSDLQE